MTAQPRVGQFEQRVFARVQRFDGHAVDEPVQLELPLGRAPPQGARVSMLAVVRLPRGPSNGFDERTWLRRQGIHVVLRVDRWTVPAGGAGSPAPATGCAHGCAAPRHPGSRENGARSSRECCSATTPG